MVMGGGYIILYTVWCVCVCVTLCVLHDSDDVI